LNIFLWNIFLRYRKDEKQAIYRVACSGDSRDEFDDGEDSERAYNGLGEDHSSLRESHSYGRAMDS
jgi:hypothetical protein